MNTLIAEMAEKSADIQKEDQEKDCTFEKNKINSYTAEKLEEHTGDFQENDRDQEDLSEKNTVNYPSVEKQQGEELDFQKENQVEPLKEMTSLNVSEESHAVDSEKVLDDLNDKMCVTEKLELENPEGMKKDLDANTYEEEAEPVFDGTEIPGMEANRSSSTRSLDLDPEIGPAWPEKAVALTNLVKEKSIVAVSTFLRRLSGRSDDGQNVPDEEDQTSNSDSHNKEIVNSSKESEVQGLSQKTMVGSGWNPLKGLIGIPRDDAENKVEQKEIIEESVLPIAMIGRIILYTRLGCQDCREARLFLHRKRLRYVEINIDVYPSRKLELEKIAASSVVPRVFFNEVLIGGLSELKGLDESGKLDEKIEYIVTEAPSFEAPLPPLSGEDDASGSGGIDELAVIVHKMKESIVVKDRFYKMRRFTKSFLGTDAVDFLSEDQYLEREEAIEFGRKLVSELFFQHVLDENVFEDGNHLYRFLDHDPVVSQCQNIPRGIIEMKPKPIIEISSRLRFLFSAILEAYTSVDGKHVDYRSIHGSEEFARYLRIVEELQRVDLQDMPREEKLAFFINLYNMMAIHAILAWGHSPGALERRKLLGDFKYVIGGCTYSLSAIQNGILRGNQRPPYNLIKPFGAKDKRLKVALPYSEPLVHFTLVCGTRSGPALRCYSPGNIDKELMEAASDFLRSGGLILDLNAKVASVSKILKWYSVDFGKSEVEVLKHIANSLEPGECQAFLDLLASAHLKVVYQPFDWRLNC